MAPIVGAIVLYRPASACPYEAMPAIITNVCDGDTVDLFVFEQVSYAVLGVPLSDAPAVGCWSWRSP